MKYLVLFFIALVNASNSNAEITIFPESLNKRLQKPGESSHWINIRNVQPSVILDKDGNIRMVQFNEGVIRLMFHGSHIQLGLAFLNSPNKYMRVERTEQGELKISVADENDLRN